MARERARLDGRRLGRGRPTRAQIERCWRLRGIASGRMSVWPAGEPFEAGALVVDVANADGVTVWWEIVEPEPSAMWAFDTGARRS